MIYLDSCVVIYAVEDVEARGDRVRRILAGRPDEVFAISPLVRMACLAGPIRGADVELEDRYRAVLGLLRELEMPSDVYERAARLRATLGLRTPDALHLATAQLHGCAALWTNDARLSAASRGLAVDVLGEDVAGSQLAGSQ